MKLVKFKKAVAKILISISFCFGLLVLFLLNPEFSYARSTEYKNITIYHNAELDENWKNIIDISLHASENYKIYNEDLKSDLCLKEGIYPSLINFNLGDDVFTAFSNKIVVLGRPSKRFNEFEKWGHIMKSSQFLSHALVHNLQFKYHGIKDANPLGGHPKWKWEGYVEYEVLGKLVSIKELYELYIDSSIADYDWVYLTNKEGTIKKHLEYLMVVKYCFEILKWDYEELMNSRVKETELLKKLSSYLFKE